MEFDRKMLRDIIRNLMKAKKLTRKKAWVITKKVCRQYALSDIPNNVQLLQVCTASERRELIDILVTKPTRTTSGVAIITVVGKPAKCPGSCIYCPRGEHAPQSYTGLEPAIQRAIRNNYDPFMQVSDRLKQYKLMGHPVDKIELIIIGGTFLALSKAYQEHFVCRLFDALNGVQSKNLGDALKMNEHAAVRCSGLTIETRADYCFKPHINQMLKLGTTRVEIGLQSLYPEILERINRMHTVDDVILATQLVKDSCLKCTYHIMPGLFTSFEDDLKQFKILFENPDFKPDSLKIYPTLVIKGTELYDMWKRGDYKPLSNEQATDLIAQCIQYIPQYCRIIRVQRDIPSTEIVAGVKKSNLRELVEKKVEEFNIKIKEIRYREVGHKIEQGVKIASEKIKFFRHDYDASGGKEIFLSFEDVKNDALIAFLRLRIPCKPFRPEINDKTALIRELHVYGQLVPVGKSRMEAWQHKGYGKLLLERAENIASEEFDKNKIVVISGVGIRPYYYKFGYKQDCVFVSKILK